MVSSCSKLKIYIHIPGEYVEISLHTLPSPPPHCPPSPQPPCPPTTPPPPPPPPHLPPSLVTKLCQESYPVLCREKLRVGRGEGRGNPQPGGWKEREGERDYKDLDIISRFEYFVASNCEGISFYCSVSLTELLPNSVRSGFRFVTPVVSASSSTGHFVIFGERLPT